MADCKATTEIYAEVGTTQLPFGGIFLVVGQVLRLIAKAEGNLWTSKDEYVGDIS